MVRKIRLYFKKELKDDLISSLSSEQSHYIKNVMRVKQGNIYQFLIVMVSGIQKL